MARAGRPATPAELTARGKRLSALLREARLERFEDLSDEEFARRIGLSVNTWRKLQNRTTNPGFFTIVDVVAALDLDLDDVVNETSSRKKHR